MSGCLLDTHAWAWSLYRSSSLSRSAVEAMRTADAVWISPASFYEIAQKVRLNKWPEMEPLIDRLLPASQRQKALVARMDAEICLAAGRLEWAHRDPFDRLLAATALKDRLPIISADSVFDQFVDRIW